MPRHISVIRAVAIAVIACGSVPVTAVSAQQQSFIVGNDRGGLVAARVRELNLLRQQGQRVEIRGDICYSTCTMYLGATDVCVSPTTVFGFHGPSRNGQPLAAHAFEAWSRIMSEYYAPPLQQWFMSQGRYLIDDVYSLTGSQLAAYGYQTC